MLKIHQSASFVWIDSYGMAVDGSEKRVGVQVVLFKDRVVMKTIRINLRKEASVKMVCNCLGERARNKQTFSAG